MSILGWPHTVLTCLRDNLCPGCCTNKTKGSDEDDLTKKSAFQLNADEREKARVLAQFLDLQHLKEVLDDEVKDQGNDGAI